MSFKERLRNYKIIATQYKDFDAFSKRVGLIDDHRLLEKIGAPVKNSSYQGKSGYWSADSSSAKDLMDFVKKNPKYHIVTQTSDADDIEEDNTMVSTYDNAMRIVNRLSYYLADGDKNENIHCVEIEDRD